VWSSGFAPSFDSTGSTDGGYYRAARRQTGRDLVKKWERGLVASEPLPRLPLENDIAEEEDGEKGLDLTDEEKETLGELKVEITSFLQFTKRAEKDEQHVWKVLERNLELIQRLGSAQVARTRKSAKKEERRRRAGKKKEANGVDGIKAEDEVVEGERRDFVDGVEKQDGQLSLPSRCVRASANPDIVLRNSRYASGILHFSPLLFLPILSPPITRPETVNIDPFVTPSTISRPVARTSHRWRTRERTLLYWRPRSS
jgi:hypothetical protein